MKIQIPRFLIINRKTFYIFLLIGLAASILMLVVQVVWYPVIQFILREKVWHDTQPKIFRLIYDNLFIVPWIIALILLLLGLFTKSISRAISFTIGIVLSYAILIAGMIIVPDISVNLARQKFESSLWKQSNSQNWNNSGIKLKMIDDLLKNYKLEGMTKEQIDTLLGEPPKTQYFLDFQYVYWLGPERGFLSIDSEWLCIKFKDNIVFEAKIMRD